MKPVIRIKSTRARNLLLGLILLVVAGLLLGTPLFRSLAAQKGAGAAPSPDKGDRSAAQAALRDAISSGTFEKMSTAKQIGMLLAAGMKFEDGELKPIEDTGAPGGLGKASESAKQEFIGESPFSALANPLVNNPALDLTTQKTQSETAIVLAGGMNLVAGYNDSGQFLGGVQSFTGYSTSTDMGTTWTDRGTPPPGAVGTFGDPSLARDNTTGTIYYATLAGTTNGMNVSRSTDGGVSFVGQVNGAPGTTAANGDKEWIAVDNFAGAGNGNVYLTYRDFVAGGGIRFTRSTDQGLTFGPSGGVVIANEGSFNVQLPWVTVGPDHAVYVFWIDQSAGSGTANIQKVRKSTDQGVTFSPAVNIVTMNTTGVNGSLGAVGGFRTGAFPQAVVNPNNANHVMVTYNDINAPAPTDRGDIYFQQSTDGGATWAARTKLNTDATTRLQWFPAIAIQPDGGNIVVTWNDRRNSSTDTLIERWAAIGSISGTTVTFGPNFAVSNAQFPAVFGQDPVVNSVYMSDYENVVADNSFFYHTWSDNRLGNPDVRFAKIPEGGPGPVLGAPVAVVSGGNGNATLEVNECGNLTVTVTNNGTATATGISGTLTTTTPGIVIQNATQPYPNLAAGASGANASPFQVSVPPTFVCGSPINFTLTLSYAGGSDVVNFSVTTSTSPPNNYTFTMSAGNAIVPGTALVPGSQADDVVVSVALPFTYKAYGDTFTMVGISTNGNLQFNTANATFSNTCPLPTTTNLGLVIMPQWEDCIFNRNLATDGIFTSVSGVMPNRIFNIEWRGQLFSTTGSTVNFEARLFEGTQRFDFIYGTNTGNGVSASIGVQRTVGPTTFFTQFSCNTASLSSGLGISFTAADVPCPMGPGVCAVASPMPTIIPEVEPNNTPGTAQVLVSAENCFIVNGAVTPAGDLDFYRVDSVPAGAKAWFYTDTGGTLVAGTRDSFIDVLAADGATSIESDDDDGTGNGGDGTVETGFASSIAGRTLTAGGTYFFRVRGFGTFPGTSVVNPYRMFLVITNIAATPEVEPNGTFGTANTLVTAAQPTGIRSGTISSSGEVDFYSVEATAGNILFISMDGDPGRTGTNTLDGVVRLIAPDGIVILLEVDSGFGGANNSEGFDINISTTGTYFVRVAGFSSEAGRDYSIMVSACQGAAGCTAITCPANITTSATAGQCSAVVNYPAPTTTGACTVTCVPATGSTFPVGTTTVTCSNTGGTPNCPFTVTVTDTQPPTIMCPADITAVTNQNACPAPVCQTVNFNVTATDNCGVTSGNVLYGASRAGQLFTINLSTGVGTFVANLPAASTEIEFNNTSRRAFSQAPDGAFIGVEFNINNGSAIGVPVPNAGSYTGLEWVGSTLYGTVITASGGPSQLRTLNPFTGASVLIGATGTGPIAGLAFNGVVMYGITGDASGGSSNLVTVNLTTGAATVIGSVGFNAGSLEFGPDGNLYAGATGGISSLFRINPATGASTLVGSTGFTNVTGLALVQGTINVVCNPPSGSCFPTGTTTVTCTATDASGNMATCSFMVTTFDTALQDDSNAATILLWNSITGQYRFCCNGITFTGVAKATRQGCVYTLDNQTATDRRVLGRVDKAVHAGAGSIQAPAGNIRCTITDRSTLNDTLLPACQ